MNATTGRRILTALTIVPLLAMAQAPIRATSGPITTPTSAIRLYQRSVNRGQCAQAYKFQTFGGARNIRLHTFMIQCAATKYLAVDLIDPGYRIPRLDARYTCIGVRFTTHFRSGAVSSVGGWYLMEKTRFIFWHVLLTQSHLRRNAAASAPPRSTCIAALPEYAHYSSTRVIVGSDFLSPTTAWVALSSSSEYVFHGSCEHGIGATCNTAQTVIDRTEDGGIHWQRQLKFTMLPQPPVWMHFFNRQIGLAAATVGPTSPSSTYYYAHSVLFRTVDGGQHWLKLALPIGYTVDNQSLTFSDPEHGWLYFGGAASGSMTVYLYHTSDGGRHWRQIACTPTFYPGAAKQCRLHSGLTIGGDKEFLTFSTTRNGWLTIYSNTGIPGLASSIDGGITWHPQPVGLPPGVKLPLGPKATVFPNGTFDAPHLFGRDGVLAEMVNFFVPRTDRSSAHLYLFRSHDAGRTWHFLERTPVPIPSQSATFLSPWIDQYLNARTWLYAVGEELWKTTDGGTTWSHTPMRIPDRLLLNSLAFSDPVHGWATAQPPAENDGLPDTGTILRTADGGRVWMLVPLPRE